MVFVLCVARQRAKWEQWEHYRHHIKAEKMYPYGAITTNTTLDVSLSVNWFLYSGTNAGILQILHTHLSADRDRM